MEEGSGEGHIGWRKQHVGYGIVKYHDAQELQIITFIAATLVGVLEEEPRPVIFKH